MKIMIENDIILEMSDLLTLLTYNINQPGKEEYFELFILLKNLYDSIGYYTYDELDVKKVWGYAMMTLVRLKEFTTLDESGLEERVRTVIANLQKYLDSTHGHTNLLVIPE